MSKLDLEKAEEPEIKLPISVSSKKKQDNSRKTSTSLSLIMLKSLTSLITTNWKILKEMGIPDHLTCLLRNLYAGQEVTVRTRHGTTIWSKIGKEIRQGCILSPCLFNLYAENIMERLGWKKYKLESRLLEEISITQVCRLHHPYGRKQRENKKPLDEGERGE